MRRGRRGYPAAILIGLSPQTTNFWLVFSESIKQGQIILKTGEDETLLYKHNEEIVENIRILLSEGFNQLIIASDEKSKRKNDLLGHLKRSHSWLTKRLTIKVLVEKAVTRNDVIQLIKHNKIQESVNLASRETNDLILERLERAINNGNIIYTLRELAEVLKSQKSPELILLTERFDSANRSSRLYQSVVQRSRNLRAGINIIKVDTAAGARLEQLGGFVCVIQR